MITIIAAVGLNNELGKNNDLMWHLPKDFKRFKEITTGNYIIMGRKTFESFPNPLPNRTHVIISRQENYHQENCIIVDSLKKAIEVCPKSENIFIIGGGQIYNQAINIADKLDITRVHGNFDADVFFPEINLDYWQLDYDEHHFKDDKHQFDYSFCTYSRK